MSPARAPEARRRLDATSLAIVAWFAAVLVGGVVVAQRDHSNDDAAGARGGRTGADFHSLVVDPADPRRIYVGGHEAVSVSADGGVTWAEVESLRDADAMGWAFVSDAVYVSGHPGLNQSLDAGSTFVRVNDGLPDTDVHALGGAGAMLYGAGPGVGVFAGTPEAGWDVRTSDVGQSFFGRILVDPVDTDRLVAADARAGVAESIDGGRTWGLLDTGITSALWLSSPGPTLDTIVASGPDGVVRSTDGGATWQRLAVPSGVSLVEAIPGQPDQLYGGRHDGQRVSIQLSSDGGLTWSAP